MPSLPLLALVLAGAIAQAAGPVAAPPPALPGSYVPERVFDTRRGGFSDFEVMVADLSRVDVVLLGEQHDDPNTHSLQAAVLQGMRRRNVSVTLSLEMFERDVQPALDAYLAGRHSEQAFLDESRPWPRYATDYRALVELARSASWPVVAANVPRKYASAIAKGGLAPLDALPPVERALIAGELQCPKDAYFERFAATMGAHHGAGGRSGEADPEVRRATIERYYQSQCAKDETMAESIAASVARRTGSPGPVVHVTGAFHAEFGTGTAERVRRRLPGRRVAVVSIIPLADLDALAPGAEDLKRADYLVYTVK
jgi:uncharacterized iron-regulated protein